MQFISTLDFETNDAQLEAKRARQALESSKVVWMRPTVDVGDLRQFYDTLIEGLGTPDEIGEDFRKGGAKTGERWLEIRYDADIPDMAAFRHSKNAQPFHTDESYVSDPADVMFFYCVNKAPSGGATVFMDGPAVRDRLREKDPALFAQLTSHPVAYAKADDRRERAVVEVGDDGETTFNFNFYCVDPEGSAEQAALNQAFFDFVQAEYAADEIVQRVGLNPGEAVAWWDHTVLHGRDAFEAENTDDRLIWKAGIRW